MKTKESFTQLVKDELASNIYESKERLKAILASFIRINGKIIFKNKETKLILSTANAKVAHFIYNSVIEIYSAKCHFVFKKGKQANVSTLFMISIDTLSEEILKDLDISFLEGKISKNIVYNNDTIAGYVIGAFLSSGSINSPKTSNYHLEISVNNENYAKWLSKLFLKYKGIELEPKLIKRRNSTVIYFKKSEQIANFLIMVGAVNSCLDFENIRIERDYINSANRLTNFDTANMKKTVACGKKQQEEMIYIDKVLGIKNISNDKERLVAEMRLENPSASLKEIGDLLAETLGKPVSKSMINHTMRSLHKRYLKLSGKNEK